MGGIGVVNDGENWISYIDGRDFKVMDVPDKSFVIKGQYFFSFDDSVLPDVRNYNAQTINQAIEKAKSDGLVWLTSADRI